MPALREGGMARITWLEIHADDVGRVTPVGGPRPGWTSQRFGDLDCGTMSMDAAAK
jgi:hypothetical protein